MTLALLFLAVAWAIIATAVAFDYRNTLLGWLDDAEQEHWEEAAEGAHGDIPDAEWFATLYTERDPREPW